jgi:hypothetical protein
MICAFTMQVQLERSEQGREAVRIFEFQQLTRIKFDAYLIILGRLIEDGEVETGGMNTFHPDDFLTDHQRGFGGLRQPGADLQIVGTKDGESIVVAAFKDCVKLRGKHQA